MVVLFGELPTLGDGGDVGAVASDDRFENIACFDYVVGFGDGQDEVVLFAAGDRDVESAAGGGGCGQGDAAGHGVGLVAGFGGGVAETDVFADVAGGEGDGAVSADLGHGQLAAGADVGDRPKFAVADGVAAAGVELPVVASGGDDVTNERLAVGDRRGPGRVEVSVLDALLLDVPVDGVDVVVGGGGDCGGVTLGVVFDPVVADGGEVFVEGAGDDPSVSTAASRPNAARSNLDGSRPSR